MIYKHKFNDNFVNFTIKYELFDKKILRLEKIYLEHCDF